MPDTASPQSLASLVRGILVLTFVVAAVHATPNSVPVLQGGKVGFGFIGSGFHQHFLINISSAAQAVTVEINLPKAFFIDIAEAKQAHEWHWAPNIANEGGSAVEPRLVDMRSEHMFDIEAPIFKVPYEFNKVTVDIELPLKHKVLDVSLSFPIHTRYEEVDADRPFDWREFLDTIPAYVSHCVEKDHITAVATTSGNPLEVVTLSSCVPFPQGILAQLPVVYWLTMGMLISGAMIVIGLVR